MSVTESEIEAAISPMSDPFELGYRAGLRDEDPRCCPYEKMTKEWQTWQRARNIAIAITPPPQPPSTPFDKGSGAQEAER